MNLKISDTFKYRRLRAGHWWPQISVSFEGIAANKQDNAAAKFEHSDRDRQRETG